LRAGDEARSSADELAQALPGNEKGPAVAGPFDPSRASSALMTDRYDVGGVPVTAREFAQATATVAVLATSLLSTWPV
jgi:hypothetical protein